MSNKVFIANIQSFFEHTSYVCMCECIYVCMYECTRMYVCKYVCMYVCMYACMHFPIFFSTNFPLCDILAIPTVLQYIYIPTRYTLQLQCQNQMCSLKHIMPKPTFHLPTTHGILTSVIIYLTSLLHMVF